MKGISFLSSERGPESVADLARLPRGSAPFAPIYNHPSMTTRIRSHAKINLGLAIGPVRVDGYHSLATVYQTLAIHDVVGVSAERLESGATSQIAITCNDARVPCDARNTCWQIIARALQRMGIAARVGVDIEKRLPVQGGLGAGSANAAAALIGLEKELRVTLPKTERLAVAAATGSDVPLFLVGGAVLGLGRGEDVSELADLADTACVLAVPEIGVSTPQAFRDWDRLWEQRVEPGASGIHTSSAMEISENKLTGGDGSDRLEELGRVWAAALAAPHPDQANSTGVFRSNDARDRAGNLLLELVRTGIENDFETVVFPQYPSLRGILETLKNASVPRESAIYAALSGSGSALFGLYGTAEQSHDAAKRLAGQRVTAYETRTIGRSEYWRDMVEAQS